MTKIGYALAASALTCAKGRADDRPIVVMPIVYSGSYSYGGLAPAWGYTDFAPPGIDADGRVMIMEPGGHLALGVTRLWSWQNGVFTRIAQPGDTIPNLPEVQIEGGGYRFHAAASGAVYFYDNIGPTPFQNAMHTGSVTGGTEALAWSANPNPMPAPDLPGATMQWYRYDASINSQGQTAFEATLQGAPGVPDGVFTGTPGNLHAIAFAGQPAPGLPGWYFRDAALVYAFGTTQINEAGQVAFNAILGHATGTERRFSVWLKNAEGLWPLVYSGQAAPDCAPGTTLGAVYDSSLTAGGEIVFTADLVRNGGLPGVTGVFAARPGALRALAVPGTPVSMPNGNTGAVLTAWASAVNAQGQYGAWVVVDDGAEEGARTKRRRSFTIALGEEDRLKVLAVCGEQAPGTSPGTIFSSFFSYDPQYRMSMGANGHLAAMVDLRVPWGLTNDRKALYATGRDGKFRLVAAEGSAMQLSCDVFWTSDLISMANPSSSVPRGLGQLRQMSDTGDLAFYGWASPGTSAVFVARTDVPRCTADLNCDGRLDVQDITRFVNLFAQGDLLADFNHDWMLTDADFGAFLAAFEEGC